MSLLSKILLAFLLIFSTAHAEDQTDIIVYPKDQVDAPVDSSAKQNIDAMNDNFRRTSRRLRILENGIPISETTGILAVARGGWGADNSLIAQGYVPYMSATGVISWLAPGTDGQIYSTQGAGANPHWIDLTGIPKVVKIEQASATTIIGTPSDTVTTTIDSSGDWTGKKFTFIGATAGNGVNQTASIGMPCSGQTTSSNTIINTSATALSAMQYQAGSNTTCAIRTYVAYNISSLTFGSYSALPNGSGSCNLGISGGNLVLSATKIWDSAYANQRTDCEVSGTVIREP